MVELIMKTFIEFGAPKNMRGLESNPYSITKAKEEGYRTVAIDCKRIGFHLTPEYTTKTPEGQVLDDLKLKRMCCRRHMLSHVDII